MSIGARGSKGDQVHMSLRFCARVCYNRCGSDRSFTFTKTSKILFIAAIWREKRKDIILFS